MCFMWGGGGGEEAKPGPMKRATSSDEADGTHTVTPL